MHIVWFSWKDSTHPLAGGAEVVSNEIRKRLVKDGHRVTLITARYKDSDEQSTLDGVKIIRTGGRYTVYARAKKVFKDLKEPADLIIDEMNTVPFFAAYYAKKTKKILLTYQLARKVWFYQMVFPLSLIGYLIEPIYLRLISKKYNMVLTESESTKIDLANYGFDPSQTFVFPVGISLKPLDKIPQKRTSDLLFLGAFRPMKRPLDAVKAFELARDKNNSLQLYMAGSTDGKYAQSVLKYIAKSKHRDQIHVLGKVSSTEKIKLLQKASLIIVTSTKEGWGLIATEANSQGTPAVGYDVDGLRDSIIHNKTGLLVASGNYRALAEAAISIINDTNLHYKLSINALNNSRNFTFENSYKTFIKHLRNI